MWGKLLLVACVAILGNQVNAGAVGSQFRSGTRDYFANGKQVSSTFQKFLTTVNLTHAFRTGAEDYIDSAIICDACDSLIDVIIDEIHAGVSPDDIAELAITLCIDLNIEPEPVCVGAVNLNVPILYHIITNRPELRASRICGIVAQSYSCGSDDVGDWSINVAEGSADIQKGIVSKATPLKVLQLTDFHYDPMYTPGSLASCAAPLCCQSDSGEPENPEDGAGYWGDYRDCDTPWYAVEDLLDHVVNEHPDIDLVYYTGDTISHRVWDTSIVGNMYDITLLFNSLKDSFPNAQIFPILGNHEPHPLNIFAPSEIQEDGLQTQWVFDLSADLWSPLLGEATRDTIRKGGYYTVLVKDGFRIIALNSNVGYTFNWWLLYDEVDPFGQLQWLADTLYQAEQDGEIVHIISHVPSNDDTCYSIWSREYRRILDRFAGIITAAFNGHTHSDEFVLYHSIDNPTQPISVAFNGGSATTFSDNNVNYKLYHVDSESYEVLDYDVWTYNVTDANLTPEQRPTWFKLYSLKDAYGLSGATPQDLRDLAWRMVEDRSLSLKYVEFRSRWADTALASGCNDACQKRYVCEFLTSEFGDTTQCDEITADW